MHGRCGWNASEKLRLGLAIHDIDATNDYDECSDSNFERTDRCENDYEQQAWRAQGDYELGRFNHQLFYSDSDTDRNFYSDGVSSFKPRARWNAAATGSFAGATH
jgi:vitamin B12 transporter